MIVKIVDQLSVDINKAECYTPVSIFIEDAVKWRVLDQTISEARTEFADIRPDDLQALIDEATNAVRREMREELMAARKDA